MSSREFDIAPLADAYGVMSKDRIVWDQTTGQVTVIQDNEPVAEIDFGTLVERVKQLVELSDEAFTKLMRLPGHIEYHEDETDGADIHG